MTNAPPMRERSVVRLSVTPSTKYVAPGRRRYWRTATRQWTGSRRVSLRGVWCRGSDRIDTHRLSDVFEGALHMSVGGRFSPGARQGADFADRGGSTRSVITERLSGNAN